MAPYFKPKKSNRIANKKSYWVMQYDWLGLGRAIKVCIFRRKGDWMDPRGPLAMKIAKTFGGDSGFISLA